MVDGPASGTPGDDADVTDGVPTITCSRCNREWDLDFELDELSAGNRAVEQFALDHERHTGHFPDDVRPWLADCRQCPDGDSYLTQRPARRWAQTHARHTGHAVELQSPTAEESPEVVGGDG